MDEQKLHAFMGALVQGVTGAAIAFGVALGDQVGFYRALAGAGPLRPGALAQRCGTHPKLTGEWLRSQAAGGVLAYDGAQDTFTLSEEGALLLADDSSPVFLARSIGVIGSMFIDREKIAAAFQGDGSLPWGEHDKCLFEGVEWFFRPGYRAMLTTSWIPAMEGIVDRLERGANIADIGCGHGASTVALAQAYPNSVVHGVDLHEPSIQVAGKRAAEAGVQDRITWQVASARGYSGEFDLICFFDVLHDLGDPAGAATYARQHLAPEGSLLLVEPFALDGAANLTDNPVAALLYAASAALCVPNSLSQEPGLGLGAQAGPARLTELLTHAGFTRVEVIATTPLNMVLQARR